MPPSESSIHNTPLAPSVEKAYYRKCIQLKRRLNEIESDNDSKKIKIERLNRGILKMRLERAFLLDELRKRMKYNVDGSEGSGSEGAATVSLNTDAIVYQSLANHEKPPPDRPHRDKRRRPDSGRQAPSAGQQQQNQQQPAPQVPSQSERDDDLPTVQTNGNDAGPANGTDEPNPINRSAAATGEEVSAGPSILEDANGDRRIQPTSNSDANLENEQSANS